MARRVVVLGLDGVPDWLLRRFADEGVMPYTARLLAQGDLRGMETVYPPLSSVSWTTFATGANPGRHRIFGFFELQTDSHRLWYQDARDVKMPSLWDYAQAHGRRTVCLNLPGTYPARPLHGVMVSGFMAPELESSVYPRMLLPHLQKLGYRLDVDCDQPQANAEKFFADCHAALAARAHTFAAFLEHEPWDLFIGVFTETDRVQHYFFDAIEEPHHPQHQRVREFYRAVDAALGRCLAKVRDEDELILLADHGFCRIEQEVFLNTWLAEHGYLVPAEPGSQPGRALFEPARTVAFSLDTGRVFLNVRGRQPEGCVAPEDASRLREEIAAGLEKLEIRVPWSAQPIRPIARVFRREEIYRGPFTGLAGDLILHPADGYELKSSFRHPGLSGLRNFTGMHTFDRASLFVRGRRLPARTPGIIDLAPTILEALGLPLPSDLEGTSLLSEGH